MNIVIGLVGAGWLAILLVLAWGAAVTLYRLARTPRPLPFFAMIEHHGLTCERMERAVGAEAVARALRRCADCVQRQSCTADLADCPNAALFHHARAFTVAVS